MSKFSTNEPVVFFGMGGGGGGGGVVFLLPSLHSLLQENLQGFYFILSSFCFFLKTKVTVGKLQMYY